MHHFDAEAGAFRILKKKILPLKHHQPAIQT
jgi:hypothetical protein